MNKQLALKLKNAGFPQDKGFVPCSDILPSGYSEMKKIQQEQVVYPTLSELIEACGDSFDSLEYVKPGTEDPTNSEWLIKEGRWIAVASDENGYTIKDENGHSSEEAMAKLWIELNK